MAADPPLHPQMVPTARPPRRAAARIALAYLLFGAAWILCSDWVLERAASGQLIHRYHLQTAKGWVFIAVTAAMLYFLIRRSYAAVRASAQAQRQTEQRTRLLVERVRDYAIFTLDGAGRVTSWNRGAEEITQWAEQDVLGKPLDVFYPAEEAALDRPKRDLAQARSRGWTEEEAERVRRDGARFWAAAQLTALHDEAGQPAGFLCVLRDVTERRRAQDALRQANQTLATVIDSSPVAIVTLDDRGHVASWNAAAEQMFGYSALEVVGQPLKIVPQERLPIMEDNNRRLLAGERLAAMEVVGLRKDGSKFDVALWAAPLTDGNGAVSGNVRLYADISARKKAEEQARQLNDTLERRVKERTARLEEANEELQAFSYTVSHDLRIPLRSLQQLGQDLLAKHGEKLDDDARSDALRIVGAAARMERQIEDLLEYSRVSRSEVRAEPVSLVLIVHELLGRLERDPAFKDAQITVREPLGWVMAHRLTLQQVILNILTNAITFVAPGSRPNVTISAEHRGPILRLCIEDNGIGIDEADRERVFHVFERLPAAERYPGLGVGLSVARRAVERMGGTISIQPAPTGGTVFCIDLPKAPEH